jgi:hypothetical protein
VRATRMGESLLSRAGAGWRGRASEGVDWPVAARRAGVAGDTLLLPPFSSRPVKDKRVATATLLPRERLRLPCPRCISAAPPLFAYAGQVLKTMHYDTEGWGLTHDSESLIMSDGASRATAARRARSLRAQPRRPLLPQDSLAGPCCPRPRVDSEGRNAARGSSAWAMVSICIYIYIYIYI